MPLEIERKFLIDDRPDVLDGRDGDGRQIDIQQGYLALEDDHIQVRLRRADAACQLTYKRGRGRVRTEVNVPLSVTQFDQLWPQTEGRRLQKRRHVWTADDLVFEIDEYLGGLHGLWTVDVEFEAEGAAAAFVAPAWFGPDITDDARYFNITLACRGLPELR